MAFIIKCLYLSSYRSEYVIPSSSFFCEINKNANKHTTSLIYFMHLIFTYATLSSQQYTQQSLWELFSTLSRWSATLSFKHGHVTIWALCQDKQNGKWCTPWYSTQVLLRHSLLSTGHTVSQDMCKWYFISAHKKSIASHTQIIIKLTNTQQHYVQIT
jgi:hypothetical protein